MKIFNSLKEAIDRYPGSYVSRVQIGDCMICGEKKDLRAGVCFLCCDKVDGEKIKGGHRLWEKDNPKNTWYCGG